METQMVADGSRAVINVDGCFDIHRYREFNTVCEDALASDDVREIEVNLAQVDYIDSSALGMLVKLREVAGTTNKTVSLSSCNLDVQKILAIANFGKLFHII